MLQNRHLPRHCSYVWSTYIVTGYDSLSLHFTCAYSFIPAFSAELLRLRTTIFDEAESLPGMKSIIPVDSAHCIRPIILHDVSMFLAASFQYAALPNALS